MTADEENKRVVDYRGFVIWERGNQFYWARGDGHGFADLANVRINIDAQLAIDGILERHRKYTRANKVVADPGKSR